MLSSERNHARVVAYVVVESKVVARESRATATGTADKAAHWRARRLSRRARCHQQPLHRGEGVLRYLLCHPPVPFFDPLLAMTSSLPPFNPLLQSCGKRTRDIFATGLDESYKDEEKRYVVILHASVDEGINKLFSARIRMAVKLNDEYKEVKQLPAALLAQQGPVGPARPKEQRKMITSGREYMPPRMLVCALIGKHSELRSRSPDPTNRQHPSTPTIHFHR